MLINVIKIILIKDFSEQPSKDSKLSALLFQYLFVVLKLLCFCLITQCFKFVINFLVHKLYIYSILFFCYTKRAFHGNASVKRRKIFRKYFASVKRRKIFKVKNALNLLLVLIILFYYV